MVRIAALSRSMWIVAPLTADIRRGQGVVKILIKALSILSTPCQR
jgi:hypothetical protein